ncbi:hypothetical protein NDU88_008261 [Pleurodeles waltl]|uniref:Uncharacterized protein n=1 Tax=Pleurodeles waltl TaxID=8319 RepID=A0AAV7RSH8_PLEWA|nr:hypothetical protein NDU88_008261 [Pleurodeles waltl]
MLVAMGCDQHAQAGTKIDQYSKDGAHSAAARPSWGTPTPPVGTDVILKAIREARKAVEHKVVEVWVDISLLHQDLRNVADRVNKAETRVSSVENELTTLKT